MSVSNNTKVLACDTGFKCNNTLHGTLNLSALHNKKSYINSHNQSTALDYDVNVVALILQYYNGVGPTNVMRTGVCFDLPNASHFQNHILRRQSIVSKKIREITTQEMKIMLSLEVKETIVQKHGLDYYQKWVSESFEERESVGITVSYDMGWNKT